MCEYCKHYWFCESRENKDTLENPFNACVNFDDVDDDIDLED